ncbi:MAG: hypothetical protein ABIP75_18840 [Pyrinomonadaceae bacterium]
MLTSRLTENEHEFVGIMNADGSQRRILTDGTDGSGLHPRVSGDGRHIAFVSDRSGSRQVWRIDLDGRNLTQLTTHPTGVGEAVLLADGQTVLSTYSRNTSIWHLVKQSADGRAANVTDKDTDEWDISADGKYLAVIISDQKNEAKKLSVRELVTGTEIKSFPPQDVWGLRWSADGKALSFVRVRGDDQELVYLPLDGTVEQVITTLRGERMDSFAWAPDGKGLTVVRKKIQNEAVLIQSQVPAHK